MVFPNSLIFGKQNGSSVGGGREIPNLHVSYFSMIFARFLKSYLMASYSKCIEGGQKGGTMGVLLQCVLRGHGERTQGKTIEKESWRINKFNTKCSSGGTYKAVTAFA